MLRSNSLPITADPVLADQYCATNSKPAEQVALYHRGDVAWSCTAGPDHRWTQSPQSRYQAGKTAACPFCTGKRVSVTNSLATVSPGLAAELDAETTGLSASEILAGSKTKVSWSCPAGSDHRWEETPRQRRLGGKAGKGTGCPFCANRRLSATNALTAVAPHLAEEWHPTRNSSGPDTQVAYSKASPWWCCTTCGHEWKAPLAKRVPRPGRPGSGCPACAGHAVNIERSLAGLHPELVEQWSPANPVDPATIGPGYTRPVEWVCHQPGCGTTWTTSPAKRTRYARTGCPGCAGQVATATNNLAVARPGVAAMWDTRHNPRPSTSVTPRSGEVAYFRCSACATSFTHKVATMEADTVCPRHTSGWNANAVAGVVRDLIPHIGALAPFEMYMLLAAMGAFAANRNARDLLAGLASGSLDVNKVRAFAEGDTAAEAAYADGRLGDWMAGDTLEEWDPELPATPTVAEILAAAEDICVIAERHDVEVVEAMLCSATEKLLRLACETGPAVVAAEVVLADGRFQAEIAARVTAIIEDATTMELPSGYSFSDAAGNHVEPSFMQKVVAVRVRDQRRYGNWSGTGAGKTLSAVVASRLLDARHTIIICPNNVIRGFVDELLNAFPADTAICTRTFSPNWSQPAFGTPGARHRYLIVNFDRFQDAKSERLARDLAAEGWDFAIIDEGHQAKQRYEEQLSTRRRRITDFLAIAGEANPALAVLAMTATPVINNLMEGRALIEMVTGTEHADLGGPATIAGSVALHAALLRCGFRHMFTNPAELRVTRVPVDATDVRDQLLSLGRHASPLAVEQVLTQVRAEAIAERARPGTIVYTHQVDGVVSQLHYALEAKGLKVGQFTGVTKTGKDLFLAGKLDVLIMSSAGATGVNRLQHRCNHLIINCLPWTAAELEQLIGRVYRQGQPAPVVEVEYVAAELPIYEGPRQTGSWSYDDDKWSRLEAKKALAAAAVDGQLPVDGQSSITPAAATAEALAWLADLEAHGLTEPGRMLLGPGEEQISEVLERARGRSEFSVTNRRWYRRSSQATHEEIGDDRGVWDRYHEKFNDLRTRWEFDPAEDFAHQVRVATVGRSGVAVGDFGCGPNARIATEFGARHRVLSVDHAAARPDVTAADLASVPAPDASLDIIGFSLSLQGANAGQYLREALRLLRPGGVLHVYEPTGNFRKADEFLDALADIGYVDVESRPLERFTHVTARKAIAALRVAA